MAATAATVSRIPHAIAIRIQPARERCVPLIPSLINALVRCVFTGDIPLRKSRMSD
jgi:hypothetical protein